MSTATLYVGNSHRLALKGDGRLEDGDGNPVEGATVEATLFRNGSEVAGQTWPLTLTDIGSGEYEGQLSEDLDLSAGLRYSLELRADTGGAEALWYQTITAQRRSFDQ